MMWDIQSYSERVNGVSFSTLGVISHIDIYGVGINGIGCYVNKSNGVFISGISTNTIKGNGVFISGMANYLEFFKGISIATLFNESHIGEGVQICLISNKSTVYNGLQLSIYNKAIKGKVVQLGLINYIKENPKRCRVLPIINMRFK